MNIPFFTDYLMLSNPISIAIIAVFVLALIGIYVLQRKGTSFGNLVIIGNYCWCRTRYCSSNHCRLPR